MSAFNFWVRLNERDWRDELRAWSCESLRVPTSKIVEVRVGGMVLSADEYSVEYPVHQIRWRGRGARPGDLLVQVTVSGKLAGPEQVAKEASVKAAKWSAGSAVLVALVAGTFSLLARQSDPPVTDPEANVVLEPGSAPSPSGARLPAQPAVVSEGNAPRPNADVDGGRRAQSIVRNPTADPDPIQ